MYVKDSEGNTHHKRSLIKMINDKVSLTKSFDRKHRVWDEARKGRTVLGTVSAVTRAFRFSHDTSAGDNSGVGRHNSDDYCCVLVKSPTTGHSQMVIAKYQRFGYVSSHAPLELYWPIEKSEYRASLVILPISPTAENEESAPGLVDTYAKMQLDELMAVFGVSSARVIHKNPGNTLCVDVSPIDVGGRGPLFLLVSTTSANKVAPSCRLCDPPMLLGGDLLSDTDRSRYIRNHFAAHQLCTPFVGEVCGLCCLSTCKLELQLSAQKRNTIVKCGAKIPPSSVVYHNCNMYPDLEFQFKHCKKQIRGDPCKNMPVLCCDCHDNGVVYFMWSWCIEAHYLDKHAGMNGEEKAKYCSYILEDLDKELVRKEFPINVKDP